MWHIHSKAIQERVRVLSTAANNCATQVGETSEWCNSFALVPKQNGFVHLCFNPDRLNEALIRLIHRGQAVNGIFPRLINAHYLTLTDASLGYHNL